MEVIREKTSKRWENKMQKEGGLPRSVKKGEKNRHFKDGATDQPVAVEEDCSDIQGEFFLYFLFNLIVNSPYTDSFIHL